MPHHIRRATKKKLRITKKKRENNMRKCNIEGCDNPSVKGKGLCKNCKKEIDSFTEYEDI